ncbi:TonB-dependent siderophore receptor [Herbaspirillum rubrisubalbicans]|uniref:TonB-dependent siderophore receptor n=1 Tax=Herbaspirillum rubrisubalbicans TaxID=80842 RepID=UPI00157B7C7A|nr:TonB-dependent receptor [Herbaspirillum rubrisubalbicans]
MKLLSHSVNWSSPKVIVLALATMTSLSVPVTSAYAQSAAAQSYHLPSAPLDQTLLQIAQRSGLLISYEPSLVKSLQSAPVEGNFTATEAIKQALSNTGLELVATPSGKWTLRPVAATSATEAQARKAVADAELPLISVAATADSGGTGFVAENSATFSRTDTPLSETPKSVSVINAAVIQSQSAQTLSDVLRNASGVVTRPGPYGVPSFVIRGYAGTAPVMSDGLSAYGSAASPAALTPTIAIASVEVVKGPSAIMAADAPPGGVVNVIKKAPQVEPFHEVQVAYGSNNFSQVAFDSTGAIDEDKRLRYRFVVSADKSSENSMGYDGGHHFYIAPTLQWKDRSTDLTLGYSHTVTRDPFPQYTVGYAKGGYVDGYIEHPLGNRGDDFSMTADELTAKLEQKLSDNLTFVSKNGYTSTTQGQNGWAAASTISKSNSLTLLGFKSSANYYTANSQNYLRLKSDLGSVKSTALVGVDYSYMHYAQYDRNSSSITTIPNIFGTINVAPISSPLTYQFGGQTQRVGSYLQEQLMYSNLTVLASIRRDSYLSSTNIVGRAPSGGLHQTAYSPSLGVMYQLTPEIAPYVNWNKGFQPNNVTTYSGGLLPPMQSEQFEAGVKFNLMDDKLNLTTALYHIDYTNQNIADPLHRGFYLPTGGAVSQGLEVELKGQIMPGMNVVAQYAYNNYVQNYAPTIKVNLPRHTGSIWTTYNFRSPALQGLGVGMGVFMSSGQDVGNTGNYHLPGQTETDLGLFYKMEKYSLNLSVKNLFNHKLYSSSTSATFIPMGPERTLMLTGTYDF